MQFGVQRSLGGPCSSGSSQSATPAPVQQASSGTVNAATELPPRKKTPLDEYETDTTKNLTQKELQRLVLLQQLKTAEVQEQYYKEKLQILRDKDVNVSRDDIVQDGSKTFYNM